MLTKLKIILAAIVLSVVSSCNIRDSYDDCGIWLEFIFDHNMEYTDSFDPLVETVDVFVFDGEGKYVLAKHAECSDLHLHKRMLLSRLPFGNYRILAVGGLCEHFNFTDMNGGEFVPGVTTVEQVKLALNFKNAVTHEFPHLWFGQVTDVCYAADMSVWPIPVMRLTNKFHIALQHTVALPQNGSTRTTDESPYTVEIVTPESGAYDHNHNPLVREKLTHRPYYRTSSIETSETGAVHVAANKINTMRLLEGEQGGYKLTVRNTETGDEIWTGDLLTLLAHTKPANRPDGTTLPLQEYFDRESDWNIVIVHNVTADKGFAAMKIIVNGWIVWETGMGV
uniref:Fimbrillin-A associated anchor proteins Mfa1 and Mfa2 n=1 Tax=termite gut metagenome TaxID=433724 RepID=S0DG38_9ZZZZ